MNIIAVDDEYHALKNLERAIIEAVPDSTVSAFVEPEDALSYAADKRVDIAFLDINMSSMNGIALAKRLKEIYNKTNVIFVTGYTEYAVDAFSVEASDYVMKPVEPEDVAMAVSRLREPLDKGIEAKKVETLGPYTFDHVTNRVYYNGCDTALFPKEFRLFCVLADNPGVCFGAEELYQKIWGDDPNNSADNTIAVHISGIRKKLEMDEPNNPNIKKRRGEGYYLDVKK